eukprot:COSAG01_NODE_40367_length_464_cov_2.841096_2_plen_33_part_01
MVSLVVCSEMYDGSRADVVQAYPNGSVYAHKMA